VAAATTWPGYRESIGDRSGLFGLLVDRWPVEEALYPGSYVDLAPSTAVPSVTYVDVDRRAARYFADEAAVQADLAGRCRTAHPVVRFVGGDYTGELGLPRASFDLLVSLFAGPVWDHCHPYLRPRGLLLANSSHGDASLAALDDRLELLAAFQSGSGGWRIDTARLERYLVPRDPRRADPEAIRASGRGVAYTRPAFAYLFRLRD
jgi:hypothetical protein